MAGGPWGQTMGGQIVGGLLGWALDRHSDDGLQPARLTGDLLRPVPIAPVSIETSIQPEGQVWSAPVAMPPMPANTEQLEAEVPFAIWTASGTSHPGTAGMPPLEWEQP